MLIILFSSFGFGQINSKDEIQLEKKSEFAYNTEVEAKIYLEKNNEFIYVTGAAINKTAINQSLRYVLSTFATDPKTGEMNKSDQSDRFILEPGGRLNLKKITLIAKEESRTIILLLIYNDNDQILGKDRKVLFDDPSNNDPDAITLRSFVDEVAVGSTDATSEDINTNAEDGIILRGIVTEETKTKPGRDYYRIFASLYRKYNLNSKEIVTVTEIFSLGRTTKIEVKVGGTRVFQFFVKPKEDFLKDMAKAGIYYVSLYLQRQRLDSKIVKRY